MTGLSDDQVNELAAAVVARGLWPLRRVERAIAHLKNWKILATGYRGLLSTFPGILEVITKLEIYRTSTYIS